MNKPAGHLFRVDASLKEYFDVCNDDDSSAEEFDDESDQDSPNYWRSSRLSPLRGKARLSLRQRSSVQHALMSQKAASRRGRDAAEVASVFARPLSATVDMNDGTTEGATGTLANIMQENTAECLFFDALCAFRQSPNESFEVTLAHQGGGPPVWSLRKGITAAETWETISFCLRSLIEALLVGANDVARAQWLLQLLGVSLSRENAGVMADAFIDYAQTCTGEEGLLLAAHLVLCRFASVVRRLMQRITSWAIQMQEKCAAANLQKFLRPILHKSIEKVLLPLRRCIHLLERSCSLTNGCSLTGGSGVKTEVNTVTRASALMDHLIVCMSALQDSNTMNLYRFYMVLLIYCSWPYVLLMTSAIFGFVTDVDADAWRSNVPRIFRLSFSHIRVGDYSRSDRKIVTLPTDILSLVLLCVGYERVEVDGPCSDEGGKRRRGISRARRRAAFASMLSSRSFILRSFVAFARQKELVGWTRKRCADGRPTLPGSSTGDEWLRFTQRGEETTDHSPSTPAALPLALCSDGESGFTPSCFESLMLMLQVEDTKTYHDLLLRDAATEVTDSPLRLWLHTSLPAARWVTASFLVPIGQVVQRLQERRLAELLSTNVARDRVGYHATNFENNDDAYDEDDELPVIEFSGHSSTGNGESTTISLRRGGPLPAGSAGGSGVGRTAGEEALTPYGVTFRDAVSLLIDVALCRDSERIVYTFLHRLFVEPHWWYRRDAVSYKYTGTASSFISAAFADAICGKAFAQFVRLSVAPKSEDDLVPTTGDDCALELLRTFASFELHFSFPWDIELILLPLSLSVLWGDAGTVQEKYASYFWKNRCLGEATKVRKECVEEMPAAAGAQDEQGRQVRQLSDEHGAKVRDSWSYCFGYLCSLHYAQISLREQRKWLQQRDIVSHKLMSGLGSSPQGGNHTVRLTRGLGSAYFELSFAVDSLLSFTQNIAGGVARELEGELTKLGAVNSCIELCQRVDALLLRLGSVCFPVVPLLEDAVPLTDFLSVRESIAAVLTIALNPTTLPLRHITSRTQNAIEALVAVVRALPATSVLKEKISPLLVLLTFNRFYGE
ncbi:hypothetical protein TraAM80_00250 [Trypanosoma rangeli]|uniref:Uncharacterized protein n=1 Tax=Trypanosoma rangeli TaxID=5698 RepID=A0A3R7RTE5_TRYRA|nr:uncharacterized protein TraAM80_00250 [Trypanosoma rangeli]RNF12534.1 hypothetical protein TraAM80_00250 [Trypanosoma rangeli]|eukprot:RNF12534.1 hypothetical protein TraAM80_00250 [Trypanosoma rangeli]